MSPAVAGQPDALYAYVANLDALHDRLPASKAVLSDEDREAIARVRAADRRRRLAAGRYLVRRLLAEYLGVSPGAVSLERDEAGKPRVRPGAHAPIEFNASRSGNLGVVVISRARRVGVDVEVLTPGKFGPAVAQIVLSAREAARYRALAAERRAAWLGRAWTRKEAVLKGMGCGLLRDPATVDVMREAGGEAAAPGQARWRGVTGADGWKVCGWASQRALFAVAAMDDDAGAPRLAAPHIVEIE